MEVTDQQLAILVRTVNQLTPFVLEGMVRTQANFEKELSMDGGVSCAAAATIIDVLGKISDIAKDPKRWTIENVNDNQEDIRESIIIQKEMIQKTAELANRPSSQRDVKVGFAPDQNAWIAYIPSSNPNLVPLHALGATPEEALAEFDKVFTGEKDKLAVLEAHKKSGKKPTKMGPPKEKLKGEVQPGGGLIVPGPEHEKGLEKLADALERLHKTAQEAQKEREKGSNKDGEDQKDGQVDGK